MEAMDSGSVGCGHSADPMATQAQSPDQETTQINHALTGTATANDTETNYWGADKAIDGIVNRDETNKQNQSRWSTNGARTFDQVAQKDKVTDSLTLEAVDAQGVYWGTRSVLQILSQNGDSIPQGTARDYPAYEVRGFMLDVGRKPISYEFLQTIVKEMAWYKMNDFQLHLNDNSFQKEYPNATVEIAKKAYSGFRLESTIKEGGLNQADLTSKDMYYTKDQMRSLIQECRALGIDIVPEFDTPAHSLALTKVRPDLIYEETLAGVDHLNLHTKYDETISFVQSIFNEYMTGENPVFDQDTIIHVGTDEYDEKYKEDFRKYTDDMLKFVQDSGRTVRLWGSLSMRPGSTPVRSEGVQMNVWNVGWANPNAMIQAGYDIINTDDTMLYIVPGVTRPGLVGPYYHDYLDTQWLYNNWNPTKFGSNVTVSADSQQLLGATFAVWNDKSGVHSNGITEQDIYDRFADALPALASKMWGKGKDLTYQELVDALAAAKDVAADGDAMDEDIQPAAEALLNAILAQRFKADKSILEDLITKAEGINLEGYTTESEATFRTALANAQAVMANAALSEDDQATVDAAVAALSDAMNGLTAGGAPETTDKPETSQKPETTDKPQATEKPENVPQTGDSAQLMVYVAALAAAAVLMGTTVVVRRRRS